MTFDTYTSGKSISIAGWHRTTQRNTSAVIYIEGDGLSWVTPTKPSSNPTPLNPVALRLASLDKNPNVFYLGRPCQYQKNKCPERYWTGDRFSKDVIDSYIDILSQIRQQSDITGFHLVGYSGGAAIAALISAQRNDILSLRTVAGNLDNDYLTAFHHVSDMPNSLNPINIASATGAIPQIHFTGKNDKVVPATIAQRWLSRVGQTCTQIIPVENTSHTQGWFEKWPELQKLNPQCIQLAGKS